MIKKRVFTLILMLMIVVSCVTEALVIRDLKTENQQLSERLEKLDQDISTNASAIEEVNDRMETKAEVEEPRLFLPKDIYVYAGAVMEIYNDCVCCGVNPENYDFYWECEIGDCMNDKFRVHPGADMTGDYDLTLHLYDYRLEEAASARTTLHVVPDMFADESTGSLSMVTIGDSLSASTGWISYTRYLSGEKLYHMGTLGDEEGFMNEGRLGITAGDYLLGTLYGMESDNAFTNPQTGEFDWDYYKRTTGIDPDVVQVFLGTNGLDMDPSDNAGNIVEIVDKIREADKDIQILVVEPVFPSNQDGMAMQQNIPGFEGLHGMWSLTRSTMVFNLNSELDKRLSDYENVTIVPAGVMFDRDYGFGRSEINQNPHSDALKNVPDQGIHPSQAGYDQIGDAVYAALCYLINEGKIETTPMEETGE